MRGNSLLYLDINEPCRNYHINDSILLLKKYWFSVSSYLCDHFEGRLMLDHISYSANIKILIVPLFWRCYEVLIDTFQYH